MLSIQEIEVVYMGAILVLRGVSMEVPDGEIISLLGANGGGKTTTLKAISGMLSIEDGKVTHGRVEYNGERIDGLSPQDIAKKGIIQIMEGRQVLEHLTAEQNLKAGALVWGNKSVRNDDLEKIFHFFPRLKNLRTRTSGYLSGGEQQMLVTGRALMAHPKVMLLDEPCIGLSPMLRNEIFEIIKRINREEKTTVLLVEQNVNMALSVSSYGYVMENGRIVLDGSSEELRKNEDIKEFYLGLCLSGERRSYKDVKHYKRRKRWVA